MKNENLLNLYPELTAHPAKPAHNLRKELRTAFPSVKFSVRYKSFSGGDEITVSYEDAPTVEEVETVANKYAYDSSQCDVMTDYYDFQPTEFIRTFGGAKFVMVRRDMSEQVHHKLRKKVKEIAPDLADDRNVNRDELFKPGETCASIELFEATRGMSWISVDSIVRKLFNKMSLE